MPGDRSAYTRGHKQTGGRGHQPNGTCSGCGRICPRHKMFNETRGFRISDPVLRKLIDRNDISMGSLKETYCPSCARHRGIVQKRDSNGLRQFGPKKKRF